MAEDKRLSDLTADDVEDIIRSNYNDIYKYCYWKVKNDSDAEDLTQETFLQFINSLDNYDEQGKPKALLYTIARNLCINRYRQTMPLSLSEREEIKSTADEIGQSENKIALEQCLKALPPEQQEILLLRYGQGLQINEIAKIMKLSRFKVMYRIKGAVNTLNKKFEKGDFS